MAVAVSSTLEGRVWEAEQRGAWTERPWGKKRNRSKEQHTESGGEKAVVHQRRHLLGNDNEARYDLIISRLPNRFEPKTIASATGKKSIPSTVPLVRASHCKIEIINDRQRVVAGGLATGSPEVFGVVSTHLRDTNLALKPGSSPSPSDSTPKPQRIHYLPASSAIDFF